MMITSDASKMGWGATCDLFTNGRWSNQESLLHTNVLELKATFLVVQSFPKHQSNPFVKLRLDNTTAIAYINNREGTRSPCLTSLILERRNWCQRYGMIANQICLKMLIQHFKAFLSALHLLIVNWNSSLF
jgi:hypothetical protein